ncbi:MAG: hypothetical protein HY513_04285 [Candidatus Aenigmarchaeota archaeon]|nr:hypothetical protein [Candidatus Aenigmarchaeota archaeon]
MSLSNIEEKVYFASLDSGAVKFETIKTWGIASNGTMKVVMHNLVKKGYFQRIKKGVYIAKKPGEPPLLDALYIAENIYKGYLAFSTALFIHKLAEELPFSIYIATKYASYQRTEGAYKIKAVAMGNRLLGTTKVDDYNVSTMPKTIYDCFHLPQYSGGYPNILKAVFNAKMNEKQWKEFMRYVEKFRSYAFCQRTGYMLSLLKKETKINIPDSVINFMEAQVKYDVALGNGKGNYIKKWNLTDSLGRGKLLSWWYHG